MKRSGGNSGYRRVCRYITDNNGAKAYKCIITDTALIPNQSAGDIYILSDVNTAIVAAGTGHVGVRFQPTIVRDMTERIDLHAVLQYGIVDRTSTDDGVFPNKNIVSNGNSAKMLYHGFYMVFIFCKSIAILSNDCTGLDLTPLPDMDPVDDGHAVPDHCVVSNGDIAVQGAVVANTDILPQLDLWGKISELPDGGTLLRLGVKMLHCREKGVLGLSGFNNVGKIADHTL